MKSKRPEYLKYFEQHYSSFESIMDSYRKYNLNSEEFFLPVVKAAYVKCYEFNKQISSSNDSESSFFQMATLRSICEDLISISYLSSLEENERQEYLKFLTVFEIQKSLIVQSNFFQKYNPNQIIMNPSAIISAERINFIENKPNNRNSALKKGYKVLPSVFDMAIQAGYEDLYKYLYYATSSLVHFRPDILFKMGWSNDEQNKKEGEFSVKNFSGYYLKFNIIYGCLLFLQQTDRFSQVLNIDSIVLNKVSELKEILSETDWPELTTFEHLNIKPPSEIVRILLRTQSNKSK